MKRKMGPVLALVLLLAPGAFAVDGVIEINAAAAAQGGITPGDGPGLPVTLSRRGSYRLTSDLVTGNLALEVVDVTAADVSLDLNGFLVGQCVGGVLCNDGLAATIRAVQDNFEIRNGVVRGSSGTCIAGGLYAEISDLRVADCGTGISAASRSRISSVTVSDSSGVGVKIGTGTLLRDSVVTGSGSHGLEMGRNALILDTVIEANDGAFGSSGGAIHTTAGYRGCLITQNDGTNEVQPMFGALEDLGQNICGSDTICP